MEVFEITDFKTGVSDAGVNYLQPSDSFQNIQNGFIYRQVLQSRQGIGFFCDRLADNSRILGIFEHVLPDSSKECLAVDTNFLYKYNTITGNFDQIPFAGSMAAYPGFSNTDKSAYISGTSYPTKTNGARFIFTGQGINPNAAGSSIFFYNGTDVRDFTNTAVTDNPDYANPPGGTLTSAKYVLGFGERLNFFYPIISGTEYAQEVLYSGIRTTLGNGDKFDVAGSGELAADTAETMNGVSILGQVLVLNFYRSNWTLEKTRDAFNPYFIRKIPSVLGTDASFSAVSWNDKVWSLGKTGVIITDGRESLRADNKIPNFTADQIDQVDFNLCYGGFDRVNNQFLWTYLNSESEAVTQDRVLVGNYEENSWSVFTMNLSVLGQTDLGIELPWDSIDETAGDPTWVSWDTTEDIWNKIGIEKSVQKTLAGDDLGFIYEFNKDLNDHAATITGITNASQAVLTISESGFQEGDLVAISGVVGLLDADGNSPINNYDPAGSNEEFEAFEVVARTVTSVTIDLDTSQLTAYTSGGLLIKPIPFYAETIPFNPYRSQGRRVYVSHVEFLIDIEENQGGNLRVDIKADEQESPFKQDILIIPQSTLPQRREWITVTVNDESNFMTFILKQDAPGAWVKITSMRIHAAPGGFTSG